MKTIKNINPSLGDDVTFEAETVELAVADMLAAVQDCSPEWAKHYKKMIEGHDYEVVEDE